MFEHQTQSVGPPCRVMARPPHYGGPTRCRRLTASGCSLCAGAATSRGHAAPAAGSGGRLSGTSPGPSPRGRFIPSLEKALCCEACELAGQRRSFAVPMGYCSQGAIFGNRFVEWHRGCPLLCCAWGTTFYALAAECDADARQACASSMPNIVHVEDVAKVRASDFVEFLERRKPRAIIIGGASPCQGNSSLNTRRKGLGDPRSHQPLELCRIRDEFQSMPCAQDIPIITFLENVGSMPREVQERYTHWLGHPPVRIEAISCGWVHRNRCFWLGCGDVGVSPVSWEAGYAPLFNPLEVLQGVLLGISPFYQGNFPPSWPCQPSIAWSRSPFLWR